MKEKNTPFMLISSDDQVTKTSLSALIQRKIHQSKQYPGEVVELISGVAFVNVKPPVLRTIQIDHPQTESSSTMRVYGNNIRAGDLVLIQCQGTEWSISTTVSEDVYAAKLHTAVSTQLLKESEELCTPLSKRSSRRKLEKWLGLPSSEATPWAIPGRLESGQKFISKRILEWCKVNGGELFPKNIRQSTPKVKDWGNGLFYFGVYPTDTSLDSFLPVAIPQDEHRALVEAWADIVKQPPDIAPKTSIIQTPKHVAVQQKEPPAQIQPAVPAIQAQAPVSSTQLVRPQALVIPASLKALIRSFHLPPPPEPLNEYTAALVAWTDSDHQGLKARATDFFLMSLAEGEPVRNASEMKPLWHSWHKETDPINQVCSLIKSGEEAAAIRSLVGREYPGPEIASAISDNLLLRWRRRLIQVHNIQFSSLKKVEKPKLEQYRREMRLRGLHCSDTWLDRLLLTVQTASEMGMMILLRGKPHQTQTLVRAITDVFAHAKSSQVRLPRKRTHLLGRPNSEEGIFSHSEFTLAIRAGAHHHRYGELGVWNPYFVLLSNIENYVKRDGLSMLLQEMYYGKGARLYSEEENSAYLKEFHQLQDEGDLSPQDRERRDLLEEFFQAEKLGGRSEGDAWRLHASQNTILLGTLEYPEQEQHLALVQRSLVLTLPNFDALEIENIMKNRKDDPDQLLEIPRHLHPKRTWKLFPKCREQILFMLKELQSCGVQVDDILAKQVSFLLASAEAWAVQDNALLTSHIAHTLLLPRIHCLGNEALPSLKRIQALAGLAPQLIRTLSKLQSVALQNRHQTIHGLMTQI